MADLPLPEDALRAKVAVALHDADCGDRHCEPQVMGAYYRQADVALAAAAPALRAQGAAAELKRIRARLFNGDPVYLEARFREFVDDEEAADCALIVADLLAGDAP